MNDRVQILSHKGKSIILVNLSNCKPEETLQVLPEAQKLIASRPPKSALVMTDVTGAMYNKDVAAAMKDFSSKNTPFMKASAVVGINGIQEVLLQTLIFITRREIKTFQTRQQASDWLISV